MKSQNHQLEFRLPTQPSHDLISSERYLESLERRLKKVKGNQTKEPTAKDMLSALEKVKEDQMHHLINSSNSVQQSDDELNGAIVNKNHTGKEQNKDEIVAIIHQDVLSKEAEENTENR